MMDTSMLQIYARIGDEYLSWGTGHEQDKLELFRKVTSLTHYHISCHCKTKEDSYHASL